MSGALPGAAAAAPAVTNRSATPIAAIFAFILRVSDPFYAEQG
jgi:hypothetical protein